MANIARSLASVSEADLMTEMIPQDAGENRYAEAALARHKREGMWLAVRARLIGLTVIAVMLPFLNPDPAILYYEALLVLMALNGIAQAVVGRVGRSGWELFLIFLDLLLLTCALAFPNPFVDEQRPWTISYQFGNFVYFFVILTLGTLAFRWRTLMALGNWTAGLWLLAALVVWLFGATQPELTEAAERAFGHDAILMELFDPNRLEWDVRFQEVVVFIICAYTLALSVRRFDRLLLNSAALERERANLSRYFSPNVVEELSQNDEPLKQIREHDVAVLFVDIHGFTGFAAERSPAEVIETLRGFHGRMEAEVFSIGGTLDKYLGDGLMATFGTPTPGERDASDALECALNMIASLAEWNAQRMAAGETPIRAGFGLHYGPVVLGDIGANRLEFAVIGNTVNVASRLEALTRPLAAELVISQALRDRIAEEGGDDLLEGLVCGNGQAIRGTQSEMVVWYRKRALNQRGKGFAALL